MDHIRYFAEKNDGFMFSTHNLDEATVVMSEILTHAKEEVYIYDQCLNDHVNDENAALRSTLQQFLKSGKKLKLVLGSEYYQHSQIYHDLTKTYSDDFSNQVECSIASPEFFENMASILKYNAGFIVSDENSNAFRLELPERNMHDTSKVDAMCSFNNLTISQRLRKAFDGQYSTCAPHVPN